jgi:hypothetical protein
MTPSLESKLLSLNLRGIFPGPAESCNDFFLRAESQLSKDHFDSSGSLSATREIFNACPDWIEAIIDTKGLLPWEGAAAWIEEKAEGGRTCQIQLKESFLTRLYPRHELIAHEMVHAMRLMFDESRFEEILACRTSKNRFRRYFGPLFSHPGESKVFLVLLLIPWVTYWAEILFDFEGWANVAFFLPLLALGFGVFRLVRSQRIFAAALRNLEGTIGPNTKPLAVALHLTDAEIERFAKSSAQEIQSFVMREKKHSLRWYQLDLCYAFQKNIPNVTQK